MIYLTCLYTCIILHLEDLLLTGEGEASLKALEEKQSRRGQARINHRVSSESFLSSYFFYCTLELISCKFHEYVGNPRPLVIRCLFLYNRTGDSAGDRTQNLWFHRPDCCRLFMSPLTSICLEFNVWCFILVHAYYSV